MTVFLYIIAALLCLVPPSLAFNYIHAYGVNVAVVDDFIFIDGMSQLLTGKFASQFFLSLHNGHSLFFGKIIMVLLAFITHFNVIAEMYLSWAFILMTFILLTVIAFKTLGAKPVTLVMMIPVSMLLFGLRPWDVFLNGSVFLNSMTIFLTILSFTLLAFVSDKTPRSKNLLPAIACGIVGSFSGSASGLLVWPVGLVQLFRVSFGKTFQSILFRSWLIFMMLSFTIYGLLVVFAANAGPEVKSGALLETLSHRLTMMPRCLLTLLGFPFSNQLDKLQIYGIGVFSVYLAAIVLFFLFKQTPKSASGVRASSSIFLFGLLAIAMITYGRSDKGILETMATRYVQFSEIMLIGAYLTTCFSRFKNKLIKPALLLVLTGMAVALFTVGYMAAPDCGSFWRNLQLKNEYVLRTYKIQSNDQLSLLQSNPFYVKAQADKLEKLKLNVFSRPRVELDVVPSVAGEPSFCLDRINSLPSPKLPATLVMTRDDNQTFTISGWAFDANSMQPAKRIALLVDDDKESSNQTIIPACNGLYYPGVAEGFRARKLADCGFFASFSPAILNVGSHSIRIAVESADGLRIQKSKSVATVIIKPGTYIPPSVSAGRRE